MSFHLSAHSVKRRRCLSDGRMRPSERYIPTASMELWKSCVLLPARGMGPKAMRGK